MLSRSQDSLTVITELNRELAQLLSDLECDMPHDQTQAIRAQVAMLRRLIARFTPL